MTVLRTKTVGALLSVVALRRAADTHRHHQRLSRVAGRVAMGELKGPEEVVCDRHEAVALARRARHLSIMERRALDGRAHGYQPRETAERYGVAPKSVHLALCRARTVLKAATSAVSIAVIWAHRRITGAARYLEQLAPAAAALAAFAVLPFASAAASPTSGYPPGLNAGGRDLIDAGSPSRPTAVSAIGVAVLPAVHAAPAPPNRAAQATDAPAQVIVPLPGPDGGSVAVERKHPSQSFLQSVESCLANGISIDPHHAGCTTG
jgi:hypothetical protein